MCLTAKGFGQQLPQFSQYLSNYTVLNPANAVLAKNQLLVGMRSQMMGFGLEPNSAYVVGHAKLKPKKTHHYNPYIRISQEIPRDTTKYNRLVHALGGGFLADRYGAFDVFTTQAFYAIGFALNNEWKLAGAVKTSFNHSSINKERVLVLNVNNPYQDYAGGDLVYDQMLGSGGTCAALQIGFSGVLRSDNFLIGISLDQLSQNTLVLTESFQFYEYKPLFMAMTAYTFKMDESIQIQTGILVKKTNPAPTSLEVSSILKYSSKYSVGLHYRHKSSIGIVAAALIKEKIRLTYSYDYITTKLNLFSNGGHELTLGYAF